MSLYAKSKENYIRSKKPTEFNREHVWKQKEQKWARKQQELEDRLHMLSQRKTNLYRQSDQIDMVQNRITSLITRDTSPEELQDLLELAQQEINSMNSNLENERPRNGQPLRSNHQTLAERRRFQQMGETSGYDELVRQLDMSMDKLQSDSEIGEEWHASSINQGCNQSHSIEKDDSRVNQLHEMLNAQEEEIENLKLQLQGQLTERQQAAQSSKREMKKKRNDHGHDIARIEMKYKDKVEKLNGKLEAEQKKIIKLVNKTSTLENENFDLKNTISEQKTALTDKETKSNDLLVSIEELQREIGTLRRENQYLKAQTEEAEDKSDQMSKKVHGLQENLCQLKKQGAVSEKTIHEQQKELEEVRAAWADAMHQIEVLSAERSDDYPSDEFSGIQQLSMAMLSKGGSAMNEKTRRLVKTLFGEDFGNTVNNYEEQIKTLSEQLEFEGDATQHLYTLLLNVCGALEMEDELSGNLMLVREQLKNRKSDFESGITKLKSGERRNHNTLHDEIEELKVKLATQASENANLMIKVRNVDKKDRELDNLRTTLEGLKVDNKRVNERNRALSISSDVLKPSELQPEGQIALEDMTCFLQCSAATIEELLEPPESILNQSMDDEELFNQSMEDLEDDY